MKKILFRKLLQDCLIFFALSLISASIIIWVFQAVNFLDIMIEDGRDYLVYINYTLYNFPKIVSKIFPFALFFSFTYVLTRYELNNELIIFWNFGVNKISLINFFLKFSIILMLIQMCLTIYFVPTSQNYSRSLIKESSVDFFESFIKPKKFNDNIKGLTIFADDKDKSGKLKQIYLKKESDDKNFQIIFAKDGYFKMVGQTKVLVLNDGQTINGNNKSITNFNFNESDLILSQLDTNIITINKVQETQSSELISCVSIFFDKNFKIKKGIKQKSHNCSYEGLNNIFKELYKRFIIPIYLPILILISTMIILSSKEKINFLRFRVYIFLFGFFVIIFSETTLKFVKDNFIDNFILIILPLLILFTLYSVIWINLKSFKNSNKQTK